MRFVTSSFNATLYKKNLTRFWPIWTVYILIFAFAMPMQVLIQGDSTSYPQAERIYDTLWVFARSMDGMLIAPFVFGALIAMAVFGYLYSSRSACMIHALPISRRALYVTNYLSGLSMLLIPNLLILGATLAAALSQGVWEPTPLLAWFVAQSCAGVFFFSFASFCAMFTGNIMALPVFYGVLNFLVMGVGALMTPLLGSLLYGFQNYSTPVQDMAQWFTPIVNMLSKGIAQSVREYNDIKGGWETLGYEIVNLDIFAIYLLAGLVIAVLGYLVYRRYETERAGDVVAEIRVHPLFRYGVGFCGGLAMGLLNTVLLGLDNDATSVLIGLSILWGVIGYFVSEMLLQKSFKIIKKAYKGAIVFAVVMSLFFVALSMDILGYGQNIPQLDEISGLSIQVSSYDDSYSGDVTDPQVITQVIALHQAIIQTGKLPNLASTATETNANIRIFYTLKNGEEMQRSYSVRYFQQELDVVGSVTQCVDALLSNPAFMDSCNSMAVDTGAQVSYMYLQDYWDATTQDEGYSYINTPEYQALVFAAVQQDYAQGNWGDYYLFCDADYDNYIATQYTARLSIEWMWDVAPAGNVDQAIHYGDYLWLTLTPDCVHTIAALYEIGVLDENNYLVTDSEMDLLREE